MGCGNSSLKNAYNPVRIDSSHFSFERTIGRGGFGIVLAVVKLSPPHQDQWFAVKILTKDSILKTKSGPLSVFTELSAISELESPFICNAHYAFQNPFNLYLILDICLGGDLRYNLNHASKKRFKVPRARFYVAQLVLALEYLHKNQFLHRDIKPDNMLLDSEGNMKLTDMGLSKRMGEEDPDTCCSSTSGTHGYMAPEIYCKGNKHGIPSEWFSVGVCLFEFVSGHRPYESANIKACRNGDMDKCQQKRRRLKEGRFDQEVVGILNGLLTFRVRDRLRDVEEIKDNPFFAPIDWDQLEYGNVPPPFVPDITQANFDTGEQGIREAFGEVEEVDIAIAEEDQERFKEYEFNT